MFGLAVLDVVIGLSFVYLVLSLACTAITELIEAARKFRARNLAEGIRVLLRDPNGDGLSKWVYEHSLIASLGEKPTYIPARSFALAFLDIVARGTPGERGSHFASLEELRARVTAAPELAPVRDALLALIDDARGDVDRLRRNAEEWFNSAMDRAAGWYKRRNQWIVFVIGLVMAIGLNADTIAIVRVLSLDPKVRDAVVKAAESYLYVRLTVTPTPNPSAIPAGSATTVRPDSDPIETRVLPTPTPSPLLRPPTTGRTPAHGGELANTSKITPTPGPWAGFREQIEGPLAEVEKVGVLGLPIGWSKDARERGRSNPVVIIWKTATSNPLTPIGWLLTAVAVSLGAPFWFDTLNKLVVVRSTVKPKEKSSEEASKDRTLKSVPAPSTDTEPPAKP